MDEFQSYRELFEQLGHAMTKAKGLDKVPKGAVKFENVYGLKWKNKLAVYRVYETQEWLGLNRPTTIDPTQGGVVEWRDVRSHMGDYERITIRDQAIIHLKPGPHEDFLFTTIKYTVKADVAKQLPDISGSISYYPAGFELTGTCHFIGASIGTFAIVKMLNEGVMDVIQAREYYNYIVGALSAEAVKFTESGMKAGTPLHRITVDYVWGEE